MKITVNGNVMEYNEGLTGASLLEALNIPVATVVAEVNGAIIGRDKFPSSVINDGDLVELVTVVGGG